MNIPLRHWTRGSRISAADLNRMTDAIRRATPVAGKGISVSQGLGGSVISLAGGGASGGGVSDAVGNHPFKIQRVNSGTLENPAWHTVVYVPEDAITVQTGSGIEYVRDADYAPAYAGMADWYEYTRNDGFGVVVLQLALFYRQAAQNYVCYWRLAKQGDSLDGWTPQSQGQYSRGKFEVPLGVVTGTGAGEVYNLVRSSVYAARVSFYSSGGGGWGSDVTVDDERTDTSGTGVVGFGGIDSTGSVVLVVTDGLSVSKVSVGSDGDTLLDYITGGVEVSGGTNVNTDNFPDVCLGPALTPDAEDADPDKAAPSAHKHTLDQLVDEDGEPLDADGVGSFFSNIGMWDSLGETGPSGQPPSEDSILTVGDIEDDASYLKPDAAVPDAGSISTDLLVLSGHRHPLNVADTIMATGPTGETPSPPPAADYVKAVGVGATGQSGEAAPTAAEFGTQPFYARVDHVHPICAEMGPTGPGPTGQVGPDGGIAMEASNNGTFGPTDVPQGVTLDEQTWTPGARGYEESYCCRVANRTVGTTTVRYAIFRKRKVSRTGVVLWVGPEYVGFAL